MINKDKYLNKILAELMLNQYSLQELKEDFAIKLGCDSRRWNAEIEEWLSEECNAKKTVFNIDDFDKNTTMFCDTEEKCVEFCNYLHSLGLKWRDGRSYKVVTEWDCKEEPIYYYFKDGLFFKESGYVGSKWDVLNKNDILNFDNFIFEKPKTDWSKVEVDTLCVCKFGTREQFRYFHKYEDAHIYVFSGGATSLTRPSGSKLGVDVKIRLATEEEVKNKKIDETIGF